MIKPRQRNLLRGMIPSSVKHDTIQVRKFREKHTNFLRHDVSRSMQPRMANKDDLPDSGWGDAGAGWASEAEEDVG